MATPARLGPDDDPLASDDPDVWNDLVEAIQPASILVLVRRRMGPELKKLISDEDVWQETIFHAWRDRGSCEWRGVADFRRWVVRIAMNRLNDAAERAGALRRGAGHSAEPFSALGREGESVGGGVEGFLPARTTTPSRLAIVREQASCIERALDSLPDDVREVVRLRLLEERTLNEVAEELGLGFSAVRHRLRRGAALYAERLATELAESTLASDGE